MTDRLVDVSLTEWEDGIDLILDTRVALPPTQVWPYVTRSELVESWFVAYSAGEGDDEIVLELDDQPAPAHILSIEAPETDADPAHLLLDITSIGRLGLTLTPVDGDEGDADLPAPPAIAGTTADETGAPIIATRITLAHTLADPGIDHAVLSQVISQVGPVWETHLRLLAGALTNSPGTYDVLEEELTLRYEQIAQEIE
jgi:hypothetical protein